MKFFEVVTKQNLFKLFGIDNNLVIELENYQTMTDENINFNIKITDKVTKEIIYEHAANNRAKVKNLFINFFASKLSITDSDIIRLYDYSIRKDTPFQHTV